MWANQFSQQRKIDTYKRQNNFNFKLHTDTVKPHIYGEYVFNYTSEGFKYLVIICSHKYKNTYNNI